MSEKLPEGIIKKVRNNIRLIYADKAIEFAAQEARKTMRIPANFFTKFESKVMKTKKFNGIYPVIGFLIGNWSENGMDSAWCLNIFDVIDNFVSNKQLARICVKSKINPFMWQDIVLARVLNIPLETILLFADRFAENYLPRINGEAYTFTEHDLFGPNNVELGQITIQINTLTTLDDIKAVWPYVTKAQRKADKTSIFRNVTREFSQLDRNKRATELRKEGLTYSQIHKRLLQEGFISSGYDYVGKMLKAYKRAGGAEI